MNDDIQLATQQVVYNLKKIREEKNISQLELAHRAGISQNMVTYIETGKRSPTLQTLIKLCVALEVSPSKLFTEEKTEKKPGVRSIISAGLIFAAAGILFNGILKDGLDLWIPTVLRDRFISDASAVSLICTILPILNIFGAYAAKFVKDRFKLGELSVCGVMFMFSTIALGIVTAFIYLSPTGIWAAAVVTVLLALSSASMLGANTILLTFIPLHYGKLGRASMVTGMLNCFSYTAAAASSMAAGGISDNFGWEAAFVFFVLSSAIGAALCFGGNGSMKRVTDGLDEK